MSKRKDKRRARELRRSLDAVSSVAMDASWQADSLQRAADGLATSDLSLVSASDVVVRRRSVTDLDDAIRELPRVRRLLHALRDALVVGIELDPPKADHRDGVCVHCGAPFPMRRSDARYCSPRCRVAAKRLRDRAPLEP